MKKTFWAVLIIAVASFMSMGCTGGLNSPGYIKDPDYRTYDTINSILTSEDSSKVVLISSKYYYVLEDNPQLTYQLLHRDKDNIIFNITYSGFMMNGAQFNTGFIAYIDADKISSETLKSFECHDNKRYIPCFYHNDTKKYSLFIDLKGKRYISNEMINDHVTTKLLKPIVMKIDTPQRVTVINDPSPISLSMDKKVVLINNTPLIPITLNLEEK